MQIVLPGALPDSGAARELISWLPERAPTLLRWFENASATVTHSDPAHTRCTPAEHWLLDAHGFQPAPAQHLSAGLAPMRAQSAEGDEPVWLGELIHLAPSRDGAALLPARALDIRPEHAQGLLASAQEVLADSPFVFTPDTARQWRVRLPEGFLPESTSPALVSISSVNDWWTQDVAGRPWRQLVNALQMQWYEDPVNQARAAEGLAPINSLWLYGGARPSQLARRAVDEVLVDERLQAPALAQDWGGWLAALQALEAEVLSAQPTQPTLVLTGNDRYITLQARHGLLARFAGKQNWRRWWSSQS